MAVPGSELCHQIDENTLSDIVDVGDVIRYIAILKSNAQFEIVAQMPIDCNETVGLRPGQFSAIHLLSILVLVNLARGLWLIRHRRIRAHAIHMQALYLQALLGAGLFTFLPGRMMSQMLFSQTPTLGFGCAVFVFGAVYWYWRRQILRLELS